MIPRTSNKRPEHKPLGKLIAVFTTLTLAAMTLFMVPAANATTLDCISITSDPDGDGWGWENEASCLVTANSSHHPLCTTFTSDPDGDGWGWEHNATCIVAIPQIAAALLDPFELVQRAALLDPSPHEPGTVQWSQDMLEREIMREINLQNDQLNLILEVLAAQERYRQHQQDEQRQLEQQIHDEGEFGISDSDGDGVPDAQDDYPTDNMRHDVNDRDGDGVLNVNDAYPDDPSRHQGTSGADERQGTPATPGLGEEGRPSGECHGRTHC